MNDWSGSENVGVAVPVDFRMIRTSASVGDISGSCRSAGTVQLNTATLASDYQYTLKLSGAIDVILGA